MATPLPTALVSLFRAARLVLAACIIFAPARAATNPKVVFDLPLDRAEQTLKAFSTQAGQQVLYTTEIVAQVRTNAVHGEYTPREALERMLRGTGLTAEQDQPAGAWRIRRAAASPPPGDRPAARPGSTNAPGAAAIGAITGVVSNAATRAYLEGAEVALAGSALRTLTLRDGSFSFSAVPAGPQIVRVRYSGLDGIEQAVEVAAGRTTHVVISLSSEVYQLQAFTVSAEREGNAASITRQRNAGNIINVVALDAYGDVADGNLGNFMQKLPGVATHLADGDIVGVMLRGAPPSMSMVTLDGTQMTSAAAGNVGTLGDRAPVIDRIPAEFIKEVEVTKASTPDMDATGLGGSAKLVTKSGFDFKERRVVTYQAGMNRNTYRASNPWTPTAALTVMQKLGPEDRFAVTFSGSYSETFSNRDRVQMTMTDPTGLTTGIRFLDDVNNPIRFGSGLKVEYRPTGDTSVYVDTLYSWYSRDSDRVDLTVQSTGANRVADYARVSRAQIEAGTAPRDSANQTAGVAPGANPGAIELLNVNWISRAAWEFRHDTQQFVAAGGRHRRGELELIARTTYAFDKYDRGFEQMTGRAAGQGFRIDRTVDNARPALTQTYGPALADFNSYTGWQLNQSLLNTRQRIFTAAGDAKRELMVGNWPLQLKAGAKYQWDRRNTDPWLPVWDYFGADGVGGRHPATGLNDDNPAQFRRQGGYALFDGYYPLFPTIDYMIAGNHFRTHPGQFRPTATSPLRNPPSRASEEVTAAYGMGTLTSGRLTTVAGLRAEETAIDATGVLTRAGTVTPISRAGRYLDYFPSLHLRYALARDTALRASYSTTMARPAVGNIVPTTTVTTNTGGLGTVTGNNTDLGPQHSENLDLMVEHYLTPVGVLSAGVFRKNITDFIATSRSVIGSGPDNGFDGQFAGFDYVTKVNLNRARIQGYELNYDQQLRMLPQPFNTLSVFANYTRVRSEGAYDDGIAALANFVPEMYNLGLAYGFRRCQFRVSYNYTSAYLWSYNANPISAIWQAENDLVDFNLQVKLTPWLNASLNIANVFNQWPDQFSLVPGRITVSEVFGTRWTLSVRGRF